jgi:hypothetical protein
MATISPAALILPTTHAPLVQDLAAFLGPLGVTTGAIKFDPVSDSTWREHVKLDFDSFAPTYESSRHLIGAEVTQTNMAALVDEAKGHRFNSSTNDNTVKHDAGTTWAKVLLLQHPACGCALRCGGGET